MRVTAVMQCTEHRDTGAGHDLDFVPPYAIPGKNGAMGSPGEGPGWERVNDQWSQATPSGELKLTITVPGVAERFEVGKHYLLTVEPLSAE